MASDHGEASPTVWAAVPLCHRYHVVQLNSLNVSLERDASESHVWAVGFLGEDESEALGTWPGSSREIFDDLKHRGVEKIRFLVCDDPSELRADACAAYPGTTVLPSLGHLLQQSVARVASRHRRLLTDAIGNIGLHSTFDAARDALSELAAGPFGAAYPAVVERWATAVTDLEPLYALTLRLRRVLLKGDDVVQQLQQRVTRAVDRHGPFDDRESALAFVTAELRRAERLVDATGAKRAPVAKGVFARPSLAIQAPAS